MSIPQDGEITLQGTPAAPSKPSSKRGRGTSIKKRRERKETPRPDYSSRSDQPPSPSSQKRIPGSWEPL